jgi:HK97 family phage portal protein
MAIKNILARLFRYGSLTATDAAQWRTMGSSSSASGVMVTNDNALQISTVFACMRAIAEDCAKLPLKVYRPSGAGKEIDSGHSLYKLIKDKPNPQMTAFSWREAITAHCLGWGNGYSLIDRDNMGFPVALWPLRPDRVTPKKDGIYEVSDDSGRKYTYSSRNILHIHGLGYDGLSGYNVVQYARECMGLAKAAEQFGGTFFGNGAKPGAVFEHPAQMSEQAYNRLKKSMDENYSGSSSHKNLITEEGMKFNKMSFAPEESQFLETRQFSVAEICRWFRMPPGKVADTTRAQGWSTLEQMNTEYVTDTLMPWLVRWEQAINSSLFLQEDIDDGYFVRHSVDALLRGDTQSRYSAYAIGRQWGWLSVNDIREKEDMNPVEAGGDDYLVPLNMVKASAGDEAAKMTAEQNFKREILKQFLADKTTNDTIFNMTNMRTLMREAGIELEPNYVEPWLPITTANAPMVSGDVLKDNEGDIVGGTVDDGDDGDNDNGGGNDNTDTDTEDADVKDAEKKTDAVIDDTADRIANAEIREISKRIGKGTPQSLSGWLDKFYARHESYTAKTLRPVSEKYDALAKEMIAKNRYQGSDFETFKAELPQKHKEFLYANI